MNELKTCATCAHWSDNSEELEAERIAEDEAEPEGRREAARKAIANPKRRCNGVPFYLDPEALASTAYVKDGSGYHGFLYTRADFGCVLHQPAEETT